MSIYVNASLNCYKCGKKLKDVEIYFYGRECTDCAYNSLDKQEKGISDKEREDYYKSF